MAAWATMTEGPANTRASGRGSTAKGSIRATMVTAFETALPGHLDQCQTRPVSPFPMELGVQGVRRHTFEPLNERYQARFSGDDFRWPQRCLLTVAGLVSCVALGHPPAKGQPPTVARARTTP